MSINPSKRASLALAEEEWQEYANLDASWRRIAFEKGIPGTQRSTWIKNHVLGELRRLHPERYAELLVREGGTRPTPEKTWTRVLGATE